MTHATPHPRRNTPPSEVRRPLGRVGSLLALALGALALASPGCGLAGYTAEPTYNPDVRSVAVPIFENKTFYRRVELNLTEAVTKAIEARTPYTVTSRDAADTVLRGRVRTVQQDLLSRTSEAAVAQEVQVTVRAGFTWENLRSGETLAERSAVEGTGEFVPARPAGEPFAVARQAAVAELSQRIVDAMRSGW